MRSGVLSAITAVAAAVLAEPSRGEAVPAPASARVRQEIVVTSQNLALVSETRRVALPTGSVELLWEGVPSAARTETWMLTTPADLRWVGLAAPARTSEETWLKSLSGKRVRVVRPGGAAVDAEVLDVRGATPDQVLFREGNDLVFGEPNASIVLADEGARAARPAVVLRLASDRAGTREISSRYLVGNLTWEADYSLALSRDEKSGRLDGWFALDNGTGVDFAPDRLRLLAGVLRTASAAPVPQQRAMMAGAPLEAGVAESSALSESRVYDVPSPGLLRAGRTTYPLAVNARVVVARRYVVRGAFWGGRNAEGQRVPVAVRYHVDSASLGRALPAGIVRAYTDEGASFAGEDRIPNLPERTDFEIETSEAFDLSARRQQTSFTQTGPHDTEAAFEITLSSRKSEEATVIVREELPGDWTMLESSKPATRHGSTAEFALPVPAGATVKLTYRVRVRTGS
jgi:hypothetical protein